MDTESCREHSKAMMLLEIENAPVLPQDRPSQARQEAAAAFATRAVHAGRHEFAELGVHAPPLDLSSTYPLHDLLAATHSFDELAAGHKPAGNAIYARLHNPTVARFEEALAELEETETAVAFASGMAAVTACLLAARLAPSVPAHSGPAHSGPAHSGPAHSAPKNHIVAVRPVYGGTDHLLASGLLGFTTSFVPAKDIAAAIRPDTALVIIETPGNPTLELVDIAAAAKAAGNVPLVVDSTFATPVLQLPVRHGAAMILHSATKFLGGHGDVVGGVVATSEAWAEKLRQVRALTGSILHPLAGYLLHRGLPTLALRVKAAQAGARYLAERLLRHPKVLRVAWPGLPGHDPEGLLGRQMAGPGSILAFEVADGLSAAAAVISRLRRITPAVSLGSTDTLIQHPAGLTHRLMEEKARQEAGITAGLLRLSVGIEDPADLWHELESALGDL